jgi:hypothetical protein
MFRLHQLVALLALLVACGPTPAVTEDTDAGDDTDVPEAESFQTLAGSATWNLQFDADAQAAGLSECTYTRTYSGGFEDRSAPWLCPECDIMYKVNVTLEGVDCFAQVASGEVPPIEWVGYGESSYFRTYFENARLSPQGTMVSAEDGFQVSNETEWYEHTEGGTFRFTITGSFEIGSAEGDAYHGFAPPAEHSCGWPTTSKELVLGKGPIAVGEPLPDGLFLDVCGEGVRLHDFEGKYLVIDVSAMDCPPCRAMADQHEDFSAAMIAAGIDAEAITLLAPALDDVLGPTETFHLQEWIDSYELHSPVLADRGYGYWVLGEALGDEFGYPAWTVVAPDLEVLEIWKGFGGWEDIEGIITEHAGQ